MFGKLVRRCTHAAFMNCSWLIKPLTASTADAAKWIGRRAAEQCFLCKSRETGLVNAYLLTPTLDFAIFSLFYDFFGFAGAMAKP